MPRAFSRSCAVSVPAWPSSPCRVSRRDWFRPASFPWVPTSGETQLWTPRRSSRNTVRELVHGQDVLARARDQSTVLVAGDVFADFPVALWSSAELASRRSGRLSALVSLLTDLGVNVVVFNAS